VRDDRCPENDVRREVVAVAKKPGKPKADKGKADKPKADKPKAKKPKAK
jgi:hypothetical protein